MKYWLMDWNQYCTKLNPIKYTTTKQQDQTKFWRNYRTNILFQNEQPKCPKWRPTQLYKENKIQTRICYQYENDKKDLVWTGGRLTITSLPSPVSTQFQMFDYFVINIHSVEIFNKNLVSREHLRCGWRSPESW